LLGSAQGGLLFPLNWFYLVFSPAVATDLMVISAYMLAASGAYFFARRTGASIAGAVVTSLIWQAGGFLIGQISHINIVHTAAMLPWVLWALDRYVGNRGRARGPVLAALVALQAFAGHQQTLAYSLMLVAAYAIVSALTDLKNRKRYLSSLVFMAAGVLLAVVQIVPTFELLRNSPRATATYEFFSSFSMPRSFVTTFVAPYVMGGGDGRLFRAPYIGQAYYTEYVAYAGVLAIMLALLALLLKPDTRTKFWAIAAVCGLVLAFGRSAPLYLYRIIYYVPVLNLFRVPARHLMEVNFAIAVLAGRGLTSLAAMRGSKTAMRRVAIVSVSVFLLTLLVVTWLRPSEFHLLRQAPVTLLRAPELFIPIVLAALSAWTLWSFARGRRRSTALLLAVLAADLVLWGQSSGWYMSTRRIPEEFWTVPETVKLLREKAPADPASYRILTTRETFDPLVPSDPRRAKDWVLWIEPDVYMMYGIQNAAGYDGFGLDRYSELAGQMKLWGELTDPNAALRGNSREIDILNTRYLLSIRKRSDDAQSDSSAGEVAQPPAPSFPPATEKFGDFMFAHDDLAQPPINANKRLIFTVPAVEADQIALLTNLSWAEDVPDNAIVGRVHLRAKDGRNFEFTLRAGVNTADWAYDRPDIRARIKHQRPPVATSYDLSDAQYKYKGHTYVTSFALPEKTAIESGEIELEPKTVSPNLGLTVFRVSLVDAGQGKSYPLSRDGIRVESTSAGTEPVREAKDDRWKLLAQARYVDIFENARALPRAWLAPEARVLDEGAMLQVIRTGLLPDGSKWDPLHSALVESEPSSALSGSAQDGRAEISGYEPNRVNLKTQSSGNAILVLSENDYPGWQVYVDGQSAEVLRVNYAQRGVLVPAGDHQVSFLYRPWSVMGGFLVSLLTAVALFVMIRRKSGRAEPTERGHPVRLSAQRERSQGTSQ
ncbi:MAG TPA: YfhO family protein, partial [Pyrinomonadaceae bacterium]|nr:YfhO family protein [Pyrinomonadaceae bacterium]